MTFQQWNTNTNQIPIDPALQQQTFTYGHPPATTTNPYTPAYGTQYHQYQPATSSTSTFQAQSRQSTSANGDSTDVSQLNDALGSAGVDLKKEEESLHLPYEQHNLYRIQDDRSHKQAHNPTFSNHAVGARMRDTAKKHNNLRIPEESVTYLALALRMRMQELVAAMVAAAQHRRDTQPDAPAGLYPDGSPMWNMVVRRDVAKQLAALEKIEREEELKLRKERHERKEMAAAHAAGLAAQAANAAAAGNADADMMESEMGQPKKKKKKDGPGVTARNMSEDVRKKMSNAVASQAAGIGKQYSWMTAANANAPAPKQKASTSTASNTGMSVAPATPAANGWARPYFGTNRSSTTLPSPAAPPPPPDTRLPIMLKDAIFAIEKERGHGGGRGSARGFT